MSELYHEFTERLRALNSANVGSLEVTAVREANYPERPRFGNCHTPIL